MMTKNVMPYYITIIIVSGLLQHVTYTYSNVKPITKVLIVNNTMVYLTIKQVQDHYNIAIFHKIIIM